MDCFVLLDKKTGGVYAVRDDDHTERVVQIFLDRDDAVRYYGMLKAEDGIRDVERSRGLGDVYKRQN